VIWRSSQKQASRRTWQGAWSFYLYGEAIRSDEAVATEGATVPSARVDETTGEPFFTPDTVDRLQEILEKQMAEREDAEWQEFAYRSFAAGYDDDEPEYSEEDGTKSSVVREQ
jgi:hypothetical protein